MLFRHGQEIAEGGFSFGSCQLFNRFNIFPVSPYLVDESLFAVAYTFVFFKLAHIDGRALAQFAVEPCCTSFLSADAKDESLLSHAWIAPMADQLFAALMR